MGAGFQQGPPLDHLDRRIIAALQVNPRGSWDEIGRLLGLSASAVSRRARRLLEDGTVVVLGLPDAVACGLGHPVLVQLRCYPGRAPMVAQACAERADVRFVALLAGRNDVVCELLVPDRHSLTQALVGGVEVIRGVTETTGEIVLRNFKTSYDWSAELLGAGDAQTPRYGQDGPPRPPDELDFQLMAALGADGRRSCAELSGELGLSSTAVARRIVRLRQGRYLHFATLVNPTVMGYEVEAFIRLRVVLDRLEPIAAELARRPAVRYLSGTTGYSDLVCEVVLRDYEALYSFITGDLGGLDGLLQVETAVELATVKRAFRLVRPTPPPPAPAHAPHRGLITDSKEERSP